MKYDPDDPRAALPEAARRRIENAHLAGEAISKRTLIEAHTEYSVTSDPRPSFADFAASGEHAKRIRNANLGHALTVLKVVLTEFMAIGKSGQELRRIMDDEIEAAATSLELTNPQRDLLKLELLQQERAAIRQVEPNDLEFFRELASLEVQKNPMGERFNAGRIVHRPASDLFHVWKGDALFEAFIDKGKLEDLLSSDSTITLREMVRLGVVRQDPTASGGVPGRSPEKFEQWQNGLAGNRTAFLEALVRAIDRYRAERTALESPASDLRDGTGHGAPLEKALSERLRIARRNAGHTQETAADALGLNTSTVSRIERGKKRNLRNETRAQILEYIRQHSDA